MIDVPALRPRTTWEAPTASAPVDDCPRVLFVDDEDRVRMPLARVLTNRGFLVEAVASGEEALRAFARGAPDVVLLDLGLPGVSGLDVLDTLLAHDPLLSVVMLSGAGDTGTAMEAIAAGALEFLTKPVTSDDLERATRCAARIRAIRVRDQAAALEERDHLGERVAQLETARDAQQQLALDTVAALVDVMEAKDPFRTGHSMRVAQLAEGLARALRLPDDVVRDVHLAGRLHDVGMIAVEDGVLSKAGALSSGERDVVRSHVARAVSLLGRWPRLERPVAYIQDHHEHWDGSGYPHALEGESISLGGRILAVADAYCAALAGRAYADGATASPAEALTRVQAQSGTMFDPAVVAWLGRVVLRRR